LSWPFHDRHREIVESPFPDAWLPYLTENVWQYPLLTPDEQYRLRGDLRIFITEKYWEGALDFEVTDEAMITVSAIACLLTLGFERHEYFPNVDTIIVYPTGYVAPNTRAVGRVVERGDQARLGEAHLIGPVILSWSDIVDNRDTRGSGHNLILHEFSHKLDFRDGDANGVPLLRDKSEYDDWANIMAAEYALLVDDAKHGRHTLINHYGATNAAEFFAVTTECFFERPCDLLRQKPELYRVFNDYYSIDWAAKCPRSK
jgi:Mlc titration factor MtfA (ptsG expression regulator)